MVVFNVLLTYNDARVSIFIVGDAYQLPNTPMKGGCIEFGVHLSTPSWAVIHVYGTYV
jgi:hypothetical protein